METTCQNISAHESKFNEIISLYTDAFPPNERRNCQSLQRILTEQKQFHITAINLNNEFAGFISYWQFNGFCYVEHLATLPHLRGNGLGLQLMNHLKGLNLEPVIVLEVEPPIDSLTSRRIAFYERQGFVLHSDFDYVQPPYSPQQDPVQLMLMTYPANIQCDLQQMAQTIKQEVYYAHY
ncbi:MAG: GNAT family N-acetyltransferase [Muribaculaceae bacterium]